MAWRIMASVVALAGAGAAAWWWSSPSEADRIALGASLYATHCASCHGAKLEGEANWRERRPSGELPAPPHDDTGHTWHHSDQQLFEITKFGVAPYAPPGYVSAMPGFGDRLSDEQIRAILAYIKSQWSQAARDRQRAVSERP